MSKKIIKKLYMYVGEKGSIPIQLDGGDVVIKLQAKRKSGVKRKNTFLNSM